MDKLKEAAKFSIPPRMWGVILMTKTPKERIKGIPHACGGDPNYHLAPFTYYAYSPRMWG
ncbi:hypothetical protein [Paucilactobacillus wasatchensis]